MVQILKLKNYWTET